VFALVFHVPQVAIALLRVAVRAKEEVLLGKPKGRGEEDEKLGQDAVLNMTYEFLDLGSSCFGQSYEPQV
jgi:hypothetical protein